MKKVMINAKWISKELRWFKFPVIRIFGKFKQILFPISNLHVFVKNLSGNSNPRNSKKKIFKYKLINKRQRLKSFEQLPPFPGAYEDKKFNI